MKRFSTTQKLLFVACMLLASPPVRAEQQTAIADIIRTLETDTFWTNRPITVRFTEKVEMYNNKHDVVTTNTSVYHGEGVLNKDGFVAMTSLDRYQMENPGDSLPETKFFIHSNDYTMSYFLYATNAAGKAAPNSKKPGTVGEATIGVPACNCAEKFWSFPMTPGVVAEKLRGLKEATCNPTNIDGESFVQVIGLSEDEKAGMWWHILFRKTETSWLPVKTAVYFQSQLLSSIDGSFDAAAGYSLNKIELSLFRAGRVVGAFRWNIQTQAGDQTGDKIVKLATIPSGVIVTDYRLKKPLIYAMEENKNRTSDAPRRMTRLDISSEERKPAPENQVEITAVRLSLFALVFVPTSWLTLKKLLRRFISSRRSHV